MPLTTRSMLQRRRKKQDQTQGEVRPSLKMAWEQYLFLISLTRARSLRQGEIRPSLKTAWEHSMLQHRREGGVVTVTSRT